MISDKQNIGNISYGEQYNYENLLDIVANEKLIVLLLVEDEALMTSWKAIYAEKYIIG
jgi:hypothetical protein